MKSLLLFVAFLSFTALSGFAQNKPMDTPDIADRKEELIRQLQRSAVPVYQAYLKSLEPLRAQYTRERRADALAALEEETKRVQQELIAATNVATRSNAAALQLTILSVTYGDHDTRRTVDATDKVRKIFRAGSRGLRLNHTELAGGSDPADKVHKQTVIPTPSTDSGSRSLSPRTTSWFSTSICNRRKRPSQTNHPRREAWNHSTNFGIPSAILVCGS